MQQHDEFSQKLGERLATSTQGLCLLGSVRKDSPHTSLVAPSHYSSNAPTASQLVSPRCLHTELPPMDQVAGTALLAKLFAESGIAGVDEAVLVKVLGLSGGNPLHVTELAQIICDSYIHREQRVVQSSVTTSQQLLDIIDQMGADRIEEFVHFRFDKLSEQCQLVLKTAAVAALNDSHFTLPMLTFVLNVSDSTEMNEAQLCYQSELDEEQAGLAISSVGLAQALSELLESDAFIECREPLVVEVSSLSCNRDRLNGLPLPASNAPDLAHLVNEDAAEKLRSVDSGGRSALQQLRFHWKVGMELRAIYDLMLGEQKESLHGRVVSSHTQCFACLLCS